MAELQNPRPSGLGGRCDTVQKPRLRRRGDAIKWASYCVTEASCSTGERIGGWAVLAFYALLLLGLTGFGAVCIGAAFDVGKAHALNPSTLGFGTLVLLVCALGARWMIRSIRAGRAGEFDESMN
jgi:hypothetical protein